MNINDINRDIPEGRLLLAALAVLSTSERITLRGEVYNGCKMEPEWLLQHLALLSQDYESGERAITQNKN